MKCFYPTLLLLFILCFSFVSSYDNQTIIIAGGDSETIILLSGDIGNAPFGQSIWDEPGITSPTGGAGTSGSPQEKYDKSIICQNVGSFLRNQFGKNITMLELLDTINNESFVKISEDVLYDYVTDFQKNCNETIEEVVKPEEPIQKSYILVFIIILTCVILYYHKKIVKTVIILTNKGKKYFNEKS